MKTYILTIAALFALNLAYAQDFFDALRYSQTEYGGTARSISMGSAFGALGGDFSSASINPAGLGFYRSGEFTLSPTLNLNQIESNYLNNKEFNDKYNFNLNNLSYVATANTGAESGIVSFSFGIGYNRLKNFNSNSYTQGYNAKTTLLNYFTDYANQSGNPDDFDPHFEGLAWNTWLIDEDPNLEVIEGIYFNDMTNYEEYDIYDSNNNFIGIGYEAKSVKPHQQKRVASRSGRLDEYLMSLGLNINHKVYIGASLGLVDLEFRENVMYSEIDNENQSDYFKNFSLNTNLRESGFGVNFKTGIILRPTKSIRLGAAFHTPTFYEISKYEDKIMAANFDQLVGNDDTGSSTSWNESNNQNYSYKLETPLKVNFSAAYTFTDKALLSVDYEMVGYNRTKFRDAGDNYDYSDQNSDINDVFNAVGNIRVGGEYRLTPNVSLRGGCNLYGNPWKSSYTFTDGTTSVIENKNDTFMAYSGGIGYRQKHFFIDFAYRLNQLKYTQKVHEIHYTNPELVNALATFTELNNQATITLGFRF